MFNNFFGQQLAKNIFGTQARPLTAPAWLDGAWVVSDVIAISYIRIAIFVLALISGFQYLWRATHPSAASVDAPDSARV